MGFIRNVLICVLLFGVGTRVSAQQIGFSLPQDSTRVVIPYTESNNLIILRVNINGKAILNFILDTGTQFSILTDKGIGDELGFNYIREIPMGSTPEGPIVGYSANELNLELSDGGGVMTNDNHSMLVLENDFMDLSNLAQSPVHGLIGKDIFDQFVVEIDRDRKQLTLHDPPSFKAPAGYSVVPLTMENGKPKIRVETIFENWDELAEDMLLKTGAAHTVLFDSDQNLFLVPPKKIETVLGVSGSGDIGGHVGRVREVKIGEYTFEEPVTSFTNEQTKDVNRGSIGMGILGRLDMIIDFQGKRILVRPGKMYGKGFEHDMSGIKIAIEGDKFFIRYVQKESPAEKVGIVVGDQLLAVNGEQLTNENFNKVSSIFSKKPDKKITLTFLKDGAEVEVSFKLVKFI
ncbi:MAG: PDZ domain-containing protein [Cytophagales bacterium]|nr:PDZ domain-containing protein [Cytophagales bacterium]